MFVFVTESCSEAAARTAVRTLVDLGVSDSFYVSVCVYKSVSLLNTKPGINPTPHPSEKNILYCLGITDFNGGECQNEGVKNNIKFKINM